MGFKGMAYVGQNVKKFGGRYSDSQQPKAAWGGGKTYSGNMGSSGNPPSSKGSMFGQKWKSTCSGCGGKMK